MVKLVGPPVTTVAAGRMGANAPQAIWNQFPATFTGSLKVMEMFWVNGTLVAAPAGRMLETEGAGSATGPLGVTERSSMARP